MWLITLVTALGVCVGSVEPCYLSSEQPNSWVVSVRNAKTELITCVGTLIAQNYVTAPMTCFQENTGGGFHRGRDYLAVAGEHKYGSCHQIRKGVLVMGHPKVAEDKFKYNIAYLEVEPFDIDPVKPPTVHLPKSEKFNVQFLARLMSQRAKCQLLWYKSVYSGDDNMKNQLQPINVEMISRSRCWDTYCPSGNRGCVAYFWTSDTYVCSIYAKPESKDRSCKWVNVGAPLVCNGTAVGMLKSCYRDRPLMIQGVGTGEEIRMRVLALNSFTTLYNMIVSFSEKKSGCEC